MVGLLSIRFFSLKGMIFFMPVYKNEQRGTWFTTFYYTDWTGTRKKKKKEGFTTKREAQAFEREFLERMAGTCDMKFSSLVAIYLDDCKSRIKASTLYTKTTIIEKYVLPYFKDTAINKITPTNIRQWQNTIKDDTNSKANQYLRAINTQISCIFNFAVRYYNLPKNPVKLCDPIGSKKGQELNFFTLDEFNQFIKKVNTDEPYYTIFNILFWTGIRRGELLALRPCDFDFENNLLHITRNMVYIQNYKPMITTPKTEKSKRTITLPKILVDIVKNYIQKDFITSHDLLFEVSPTVLFNKLKHYIKLVGLKTIRIHDFRHSHASLLIEQGYSPLMIAERLGHEKIETTLKTYSHLYPNKQNELAEKLQQLHQNI